MSTSADTQASTTVEAGAGAAAPSGAVFPLTRTGARSHKKKVDPSAPATEAGKPPGQLFPPYRMARVDSLMPNDHNARVHTREAVDALARQIAATRWTAPILVAGKKNLILAGHRRRLAAMALKLVEVPVIDIGHLSAMQRRAYLIWDNQSTIEGEWDKPKLASELIELHDGGYDLSFTGFTPLELSDLMDAPTAQLPPPVRHTEKTVECPKCSHVFAP